MFWFLPLYSKFFGFSKLVFLVFLSLLCCPWLCSLERLPIQRWCSTKKKKKKKGIVVKDKEFYKPILNTLPTYLTMHYPSWQLRIHSQVCGWIMIFVLPCMGDSGFTCTFTFCIFLYPGQDLHKFESISHINMLYSVSLALSNINNYISYVFFCKVGGGGVTVFQLTYVI